LKRLIPVIHSGAEIAPLPALPPPAGKTPAIAQSMRPPRNWPGWNPPLRKRCPKPQGHDKR